MRENNETLEHVRALLLRRELTGNVILECRDGRIERIRAEELLDPPFKLRERARKERAKPQPGKAGPDPASR